MRWLYTGKGPVQSPIDHRERNHRLGAFGPSQKTRALRARRYLQKIYRVTTKKPPKKTKDRKQPDGKKPNSSPKKFCLHYLGFLAKVNDLNGNPVSNCEGNTRCKSYTHGRLTSDLKEQTKESAKNYFKDSSILSRVHAYINSC